MVVEIILVTIIIRTMKIGNNSKTGDIEKVVLKILILKITIPIVTIIIITGFYNRENDNRNIGRSIINRNNSNNNDYKSSSMEKKETLTYILCLLAIIIKGCHITA